MVIPERFLRHRAFFIKPEWAGLLPGLALTGGLATVAIQLSTAPWFKSTGISALTLSIAFGMLVGNTLQPLLSAWSPDGVNFSKQTVLRAGIVLFGFKLTVQDIASVGIPGVLIDALVLSSTFALSCWAGTRLFGLDRETSLLIGAGSSICGAAAIMASEPVVKGRVEQVAVAVSTVVLFGTIGLFLYPALYHWNERHPLVTVSQSAYGMFAGSTIHEVAQVVAAGRAVTEDAANIAVITKMVRVMMLAPFLMLLSAYLNRNPAKDVSGSVSSLSPRAIVIPWFALAFVAVAILHSVVRVPPVVQTSIDTVDTFLLATAMCALGVSTQISAIKKAGVKPLALAALLFCWLILGGLFINAGVTWAFAGISRGSL